MDKKKLMEFRDSEGSLWTIYETDVSERVANLKGNMIPLIIPKGPIRPIEIIPLNKVLEGI